MDELIAQLTNKVGIEQDVAEKAVGNILDFLRREGPAEQVNNLISAFPGVEALIDGAGGGGGFSSLLGGGIMALGSKLMGLGLGMGEIQSIARELFKIGREKIGADQMGEIISSTPGLSQFA